MPAQSRIPSPRRSVPVVVAAIAICFVVLPPLRFLLEDRNGRRESARARECADRLDRLGAAFMAYAEDHQERLPDAATWADDIRAYVRDKHAWRCPSDSASHRCSYAMNARLSRRRLTDIGADTRHVLLYETDDTARNPHGDGKDLCAPRHSAMLNPNPGVFRFDTHDNMSSARCYLFLDGLYPRARTVEAASKVHW